jgi:glycosyltransferase involved in cell wall biosynthesis
MDISVLISTWNNSRRLNVTLDTIKDCVIPEGARWELVIINNNCTDNTDEIVAPYLNILPIVYLKEPVQGVSRAKNTGLSAASGKLIIFTDDDVKVCREWIKIYWKAFNEDSLKHFWGGPVESEFEGGRPEEDMLVMAPCSVRGLNLGVHRRGISDKEYFIGANWAAPLSVIKEIGGFDVNKGQNPFLLKVITGEESSLMDALRSRGFSGLYLPDAWIKHFVPREKCTLEHILARCEAGARESYDKYDFRFKSWVWRNKPVGLYAHGLVNFLRYLLSRYIFRKGIAAYIKWRIVTIVTKSLEQKLNNKH